MHVSVRNRLTKEMTALLFAADDMLEAQAAALALQEMTERDTTTPAVGARANPHLRWALETGLSVAYARAFTSSTFQTLDRGEYRPVEPSLAWIHDYLIEMRDDRYAHTDKDAGRSASFASATSKAVQWERLLFPQSRFAEAVALCELQRHRFEREALERQLSLARSDPT